MAFKKNGKYFDWGSIELSLDGFVPDIQEISYDDEVEKEATYGLGAMPKGYGVGNYKANLKMVFLRDDYDELQDWCKQKGVPFYKLVIDKVVINYADDGEQIRTDVITKITPMKRSTGPKQGDKSVTVDVEFLVFGKIKIDGQEPL